MTEVYLNETKPKKERLPLLGWIIVPLLAVWIATNYLIGLTNKPNWGASISEANSFPLLSVSSPTAQNIFSWDGNGLVSLWFDNAFYSQYSLAYPLLQSEGYKASLTIFPALINTDNFMSWAEVTNLKDAGWEIDAGIGGQDCGENVPLSEKDIYSVKDDLVNHSLRVDTAVFSCPNLADNFLALIKNYYLGYRGINDGINGLPISSPYQINIKNIDASTSTDDIKILLKEVKAKHEWIIFVFGNISDDNKAIQFKKLKDIVNLLKESNLEVVLPSAVFNMNRK